MANRTRFIRVQQSPGRLFAQFQQNVRYENLARFMYKIQERYGPQERYQDRKPAYTEKALFDQLRASRVLTKDGEVRADRLEKWAKARGFKAFLPKTDAAWGSVTEGGSP